MHMHAYKAAQLSLACMFSTYDITDHMPVACSNSKSFDRAVSVINKRSRSIGMTSFSEHGDIASLVRPVQGMQCQVYQAVLK